MNSRCLSHQRRQPADPPGFGYDRMGNPTTYESVPFAYDPEDRLTSAPTKSGGTFTAVYDGDGLRGIKTANGATTYFLYDGGTLLAEEQMSGASARLSAVDGWGADGLRARWDGTQGWDFVYDPQGSVVARQNPSNYSADGAAYDLSFYEGYGALRQDVKVFGGASITPPDPVGFGGQFGYYTDTETGLLCLTHRYYDPGTGKFLNRDPIGYAGGENLYGFADDNPVNEMDPEGEAPAVGHHYIPQSIFRRANLPPEVLRYFNKATTGPIPGGHNYTGHGAYNRAVKSMWNSWLEARRINPSQMSLAQAKEFVTMVRTSNQPTIRNFLDGITYQYLKAAAARPGVHPEVLKAISVVKPMTGLGVSFSRFMKFIPDIPGPLMEIDMIPHWMYDPIDFRKLDWEQKHPGLHYPNMYRGA